MRSTVYRCRCEHCLEQGRTVWIVVSPDKHRSYWATWQRAILRATKGY